ncbi:hypothetical protein [Nocardioides sp.]|uniref:hypothetical protein n=1 Tax=Nocardioides sp. TaxID=35761 RepID=UPI003565359B
MVAGLVAGAAPALAAPVFVNDETSVNPYGGASTFNVAGGAGCAAGQTGFQGPSVALIENGPAVTASVSGSGSFSANDPDDTATGQASATGTGKITSKGGNLDSLDLKVDSRAKLTGALPTSSCARNVRAGLDLNFTFTITQPGFLITTLANRGLVGYGEIYVYRSVLGESTHPYIDSYSEGMTHTVSQKTFLPAGTYSGYFEGQSGVNSQASYDGKSVFTAHGQFNVAGSRISAVKGPAKRYVTMPTKRSCAAHTVSPKITSNKSRAKTIKTVKFIVNGKVVKTVKAPKKGKAVALRLGDEATANVRAVVKAVPKQGKPAKTYTVSTDYEACL